MVEETPQARLIARLADLIDECPEDRATLAWQVEAEAAIAALLPQPAERPQQITEKNNEDSLSRIAPAMKLGAEDHAPTSAQASAGSENGTKPFQSCYCPAAVGENCPLTPDECDARTADYIGMPWFGARLRRVWDGFVSESMNGVVCSIPDTGLNTPPHRTWCVRCQRRYMELKTLVEMMESRDPAALPQPAERPSIEALSTPTEEELSDQIDTALKYLAMEQGYTLNGLARLFVNCQRRMSLDWEEIGSLRRQLNQARKAAALASPPVEPRASQEKD